MDIMLMSVTGNWEGEEEDKRGLERDWRRNGLREIMFIKSTEDKVSRNVLCLMYHLFLLFS